MDNKTRCVVPVDKVEFDLLKEQVAALTRQVEALKNANKTYGAWGCFPPNEQKYFLDCSGIIAGVGKLVIETAKGK